MPTDHNPQHGRRPHYNRSRRGPDRRGPDRRASAPAQDPAPRTSGGGDVDVEHIMRDIRARIAQRHGIELSTQQIQELAARRLEAILDPRTLNPSLMEQLRKNAGAAPDLAPATPDPGFTFEDTTLFETHRGILRFMRRLLRPLLMLFFNPAPLTDALKTQSRLNREGAARETERERRQTEWNALHYDILQRLVTEVSRVSIETQALTLRVESLSAKVDFNDRRVRSLETTAPQGRPPQQPRAERPDRSERPERPEREPPPAPPATATTTGEPVTADAAPAAEPAPIGEVPRRKRRRRRGRRSGAGGAEGAPFGAVAAAGDAGDAGVTDAAGEDTNDGDDGGDDEDAAEASPDMPTPPIVAGFVETPPPAAEPVRPEGSAPPPAGPVTEPAPQSPAEPVQPMPPRDEPSPAAPVDHQDPGPPDR